MFLKEINPFVRRALIGHLSAKTSYDVFFELRAPDTRLFYIAGGEGEMVIEGEAHKIASGTLILLPGGTRYTWCPERTEVLEYIAVNFDYTRQCDHITKSFHPVHAELFKEEDIIERIHFEDAEELMRPILLPSYSAREAQLRQLVTEHSLGGLYSGELQSAILKSIIISTLRELRTPESTATDGGISLVREIIRYVQTNYSSEISYETIAEAFHLNPIYINRVFKRHTGTSLHAYILTHRINTAMELLRATSIPVKDIAAMVGFSDLPHFLKTFKRHSGKTPSAYRNSVEG